MSTAPVNPSTVRLIRSVAKSLPEGILLGAGTVLDAATAHQVIDAGARFVVAPVFDPAGRVRAVLDVDSDTPAAFDAVDAQFLEEICRCLNRCPPNRVSPC